MCGLAVGKVVEGTARLRAEAEKEVKDLQSICFTSLMYSH